MRRDAHRSSVCHRAFGALEGDGCREAVTEGEKDDGAAFAAADRKDLATVGTKRKASRIHGLRVRAYGRFVSRHEERDRRSVSPGHEFAVLAGSYGAWVGPSWILGDEAEVGEGDDLIDVRSAAGDEETEAI